MLDQLDTLHTFPLPENLVEQEFENIWRQVTHDIEHHGKSFEDGGHDRGGGAQGVSRASPSGACGSGSSCRKIGENAEVTVTDEELQGALYEQARRYRGQEKQVFDYYRKNPDALQALRAPIFEEKVVDYILEFADVTDKTVSKEELLADDEERRSRASSPPRARSRRPSRPRSLIGPRSIPHGQARAIGLAETCERGARRGAVERGCTSVEARRRTERSPFTLGKAERSVGRRPGDVAMQGRPSG